MKYLLAILGIVTVVPAMAQSCIQPPVGCRVSSPYGYRIHPVKKIQKLHRGMDFACPVGTPVQASIAGRAYGMDDVGGGHIVKVENGGITLKYMHNSDIKVPYISGSKNVAAGEVISDSGNTGTWTTGPHLHFEYWAGAESQNPALHICGGAQSGDVTDTEDDGGFTQTSDQPLPGYTTLPPNPPLDMEGGSLMQALATAVSSKFSNAEWVKGIAGLPQKGLLDEISYMRNLHTWATYQKMIMAEYIQVGMADNAQIRARQIVGNRALALRAKIESGR